MLKRIRTLAPIALLLAAAGCKIPFSLLGEQIPQVVGSGKVVEESREVPDFQAFEVGGAMNATVGFAEKPSLKLQADDNILPLIKTEVRDGRLVVRVDAQGGISTSRPIQVFALTPKLEAVSASGASNIQAAASAGPRFKAEASGASEVSVREIDSDTLDAEASGASTVTLMGRAKSMGLTASGASTVEAMKLEAESVTLDVSGSSRAEVKASASARGSASGASDITVEGTPAERAIDSSGASHVSFPSAGR